MNFSSTNIDQLISIIEMFSEKSKIFHKIGLCFDLGKIDNLKKAIELKDNDKAEHEFKNFFKEIIKSANSYEEKKYEKVNVSDFENIIDGLRFIVHNNQDLKIQTLNFLKEELNDALEELQCLLEEIEIEEESCGANTMMTDFDEKSSEKTSKEDTLLFIYDKEKLQENSTEGAVSLQQLYEEQNRTDKLRKKIQMTYDKFEMKKFDKKNYYMQLDDVFKIIKFLNKDEIFLSKVVLVNIVTDSISDQKIDDVYCELLCKYKMYFVKITFFANNDVKIIDASEKAYDMSQEKPDQYKKIQDIFSFLKNTKYQRKKNSIIINDDEIEVLKEKKEINYNLPPLTIDDSKKFYKITTIDFNNHKNSIDIFYDTEQNMENYIKKNKSKDIEIKAEKLTLEKDKQKHIRNICTISKHIVIKDTKNKQYTQKMSIAYNSSTLEYIVLLSENQQQNNKSTRPSQLFNMLNFLIKKELNEKNLEYLRSKYDFNDVDTRSIALFIGNSSNNKKIEEKQELIIAFDCDSFYFFAKSNFNKLESINFNLIIFANIIKKEEIINDSNKNQIMRSTVSFKTKDKNDIVLNFFIELSEDKSEYSFCFNEVSGSISDMNIEFEEEENNTENKNQIEKLYKLFKLKHNHLIERQNDDVDNFIKRATEYYFGANQNTSSYESFSDEQESIQEDFDDTISTNLDYANSSQALQDTEQSYQKIT